jgi:3-oxoacyl-[acyl-carrier-protein] synthase II
MTAAHNSSRRVAITGIGIVSPIGIGREAFTNSLEAGKSGVSILTGLPASAVPHHIGGEVKDFNEKTAKNYIKQRKSIKVMCREIQLGVAAATLALEDAGIAEGSIPPERLGVEYGANLMLSPPDILFDAGKACSEPDTLKFHHEMWGSSGLSNMGPLWLLQYLPNMPACHIGIFADARGPNNSLTMAEASGNLALGEAYRILTRGSADVMITGTTGTTTHAVKSLHAVLWDKLADTNGPPEEASRPFDADRTGQVVAEGAATFILEDEAFAQQRGAKIFGFILGTGSSCVADSSGAPNLKLAMTLAMQAALKDAGLQPADIGHINAHGLGTPKEDALEAQAIHDVFGPLGDKVPVTAFKSYWGNPGSSCGTLELAASIVGLQSGHIYPTLNYHRPDPACRLNVVHGKPLPTSNNIILKVSVTRNGQASASVVQGKA